MMGSQSEQEMGLMVSWIQTQDTQALQQWIEERRQKNDKLLPMAEQTDEFGQPWFIACLKQGWWEGIKILMEEMKEADGCIKNFKYGGGNLLHWTWCFYNAKCVWAPYNVIAKQIIEMGVDLEALDGSTNLSTTAGEWAIMGENRDGFSLWYNTLSIEAVQRQQCRLENFIKGDNQQWVYDIIRLREQKDLDALANKVITQDNGKVKLRL